MTVSGTRTERMDPVDVAWLHMDRPTNLMVVNTVLWFDVPVDQASVLEMFGERADDVLPVGPEHQVLAAERAPSPAGSPGVILRGWTLIIRPGCHRSPGQCEHCGSRSSSWTGPARSDRYRTPPPLCRHPRCPGPGDGLARGWLWRCRGCWFRSDEDEQA